MAKAKKNVYVRFIYEEGEEGWDDQYGPYTPAEAQQEADNLKKEFAYAISSGTAEVGFMINGNYEWNIPKSMLQEA